MTSLDKLIEAMQRTQQSLQKLAREQEATARREAFHMPMEHSAWSEAEQNRAAATVLGDFIRLAAEHREADKEREASEALLIMKKAADSRGKPAATRIMELIEYNRHLERCLERKGAFRGDASMPLPLRRPPEKQP